MAAIGKPNIRGEQRSELVQDLAQRCAHPCPVGGKYDRHVQAIAQFAVRNRGEIAVIRAGTQQDAARAIAESPSPIRRCVSLSIGYFRDDLLTRLEDPGLDDVDRNRYTKTVMSVAACGG